MAQITLGDGRCDLGHVPQLDRQVAGHGVHVIGEILPGTGHPLYLGLTTQLPFGTDLPGHPGYFRGKRAELINHGVDHVLDLEDLAFNVHGDFLGKVTLGDGCCDLGHVPQLDRQIARHGVHVVGQILPGPRHAFYLSLPTQLALGTHLPGYPRDLGREGLQLVHHGIYNFCRTHELAAHGFTVGVENDALGQIPFRHRTDNPGHFCGGHGQVEDEGIDRVTLGGPGAVYGTERDLLGKFALFAGRVADPVKLARDFVVDINDIVERVGYFAVDTGPVEGHTPGEISFLDRGKYFEQHRRVKFSVGGQGGIRRYGGVHWRGLPSN